MASREDIALMSHLMRRAGFGASRDEIEQMCEQGYEVTVEQLLNPTGPPVDEYDLYRHHPITEVPGGAAAPGQAAWLYFMATTQRPLEEKMTLFWHGILTSSFRKTGSNPAMYNQNVLFRRMGMDRYNAMLKSVSRDPAMLIYLDSRKNKKRKPNENYSRELMELFTMGVDFFTESDVYAGARVFTGWNLRNFYPNDDDRYSTFRFRSSQHDTDSKTFSFPIYPDGGKTIPARSAGSGQQDGLDLINAVAAHPETGPRLARKLYAFFVSELKTPPESFIQQLAGVYYSSGYDMRAVVGCLLRSAEFQDPANYFARYSWPVEYVTRLLKAV